MRYLFSKSYLGSGLALKLLIYLADKPHADDEQGEAG